MKSIVGNATKIVGMLGLLFALFLPSPGRADGVEKGWDLFETLTATFMGQPFVGVPYGTFDFNNDFGRNLGVQNVGNTDTIVRRNQFVPNTGNTPGTTTLDLVGLQLMSENPFDPGFGLDSYFVTLQSVRGGPASAGSMDIRFQYPEPGFKAHGTFDSSIDVFFDLRKGSLTGPIVLSDNYLLSSTKTLWTHFELEGELLVEGVNHDLNGTPGTTPGSWIDGDRTQDFQTNVIRELVPRSLAIHKVKPTGALVVNLPPETVILQGDGPLVPEPGSVATVCAGSLLLTGFCHLRRRRRAA